MNNHSHDTRSAIENKMYLKKPSDEKTNEKATVEKPHVFFNYISRNQSHTIASTAKIIS